MKGGGSPFFRDCADSFAEAGCLRQPPAGIEPRGPDVPPRFFLFTSSFFLFFAGSFFFLAGRLQRELAALCARMALYAAEPQVLVIDDETGSRESMALAIQRAGFVVRTFDDARRALELLEETDTPQLAVCDLRMPGLDGLGFLNEVRKRGLDLAVILVTGFGSIESAVEAMRVGADDYLTKPVDLYELRKRVLTQLEKRQLKEKVVELNQQLDKRFGFESIIGRSAKMEVLFEQMRLVAPTKSTVLIIGESGTGKELVANALHLTQPAPQRALPGDQLRRDPARHPRERALRPRARLVHRRHRPQDRQVRAGARAARSSSTRSASSTRSSRSSCCACSRSGGSCGSAAAS